ncbi:hypothetical protein ACFFHJ_00170 [Planotetraspora thailandica]|uniref:hypothetical protein n=1 Tax=Planotetraspora thailandica TaxID=487172 RepID=UPI00194EF732|nr:hypothetical protein [Planotetraspora thailandica]
MTARRADLLRYGRAHHLGQMALGFAAATAVACWAGNSDLVLPAANGNGWTEMASTAATAIPFAVFAAGSLHSAMASLEQAAGGRLLKAELVHFAGALLLAAALIGTATAATGSAGGAAEAVRNLILYAGFALVSGRLFGRSLSWIVPLAGFVVVDFWGSDGVHPYWWAWQFHVYDSAWSWVAAGACLACGLAALLLPPRPLTGTARSLWPAR